jgi:hypothetical protein
MAENGFNLLKVCSFARNQARAIENEQLWLKINGCTRKWFVTVENE